MDYRFLGKSGLKVSELAMGAQTFGWGADRTVAHVMADRFVEAGGNMFDTSSTYNEGESESILGEWLHRRRHRDALVIASKVYFPTGDGANEIGLSRKHIFEVVERSLRRLRTDYVDIYQAHCYDLSTPLEETLTAFEDLVRLGKVRYVGLSNFTPGQLMKSVFLGRDRGVPLVSLQAEYSLLVRETEWELLPLCEEEGLGLLAWSPLAGGWLTGKYHKGQAASEDSRVGRGDRWDDQPEQRESELAWRVIARLVEIAAARAKTPSQVAINYLLRRSEVVVPIFGARTPEQLEENLGSTGWELHPAEVDALSEISNIPLPYPYRFIERYSRKRHVQETLY
jgi:aryl-alcohol dehydrogenase-like predicted oxidoreductase